MWSYILYATAYFYVTKIPLIVYRTTLLWKSYQKDLFGCCLKCLFIKKMLIKKSIVFYPPQYSQRWEMATDINQKSVVGHSEICSFWFIVWNLLNYYNLLFVNTGHFGHLKDRNIVIFSAPCQEDLLILVIHVDKHLNQYA